MGNLYSHAKLHDATRNLKPTKKMKTQPTTDIVKIQIASAMDDCGTNEIRSIEMTKDEEKEYNDGMARLAEMWG